MVPSSSGHRHVFQTLCKCGLGLARRISWTEMNLARRFLVCPRPSPSPQRFDAFYWIDGELFSDWYRNMMYEMNNTMNPDHREIFEDVVHRHEMEIVSQERISILEEELESHKSSNFDELEKAIVKAASWKKIACVLMFVLSVFECIALYVECNVVHVLLVPVPSAGKLSFLLLEILVDFFLVLVPLLSLVFHSPLFVSFNGVGAAYGVFVSFNGCEGTICTAGTSCTNSTIGIVWTV
ncbi:hypothetical protein Tco_0775492 [Tanacetum coccineum]